MQVIFRFMRDNNNLAELEASLAPAEAEFGAVAKADQTILLFLSLGLKLSEMGSNCFLTASIDTRRLQLLVSGVQLLPKLTHDFVFYLPE